MWRWDGEEAHQLHKARRELILRRPPDGRLQVVPRLRIVELDCAQPPGVKEPSDGLRLRCAGRVGRARNELVGLVVLVLGEIRAEQEVDDGRLERLVFAQRGRLASREQDASHVS